MEEIDFNADSDKPHNLQLKDEFRNGCWEHGVLEGAISVENMGEHFLEMHIFRIPMLFNDQKKFAYVGFWAAVWLGLRCCILYCNEW